MPKRSKKSDNTPVKQRNLKVDILAALIYDTIYVFLAVIAIHALGWVANYLGEGNASIIKLILGLSDSFYLAVYFLSVARSLIVIVIRGINEVATEYDDLKATRKRTNKKTVNRKIDKQSHK